MANSCAEAHVQRHTQLQALPLNFLNPGPSPRMYKTLNPHQSPLSFGNGICFWNLSGHGRKTEAKRFVYCCSALVSWQVATPIGVHLVRLPIRKYGVQWK